jgi:hypothetical protein
MLATIAPDAFASRRQSGSKPPIVPITQPPPCA